MHQNHINRVQYSPATDLLLVLEQGNKELKFYNADCEIKHRIEPKFEEKAFIIDACYAHAINMVKTLLSHAEKATSLLKFPLGWSAYKRQKYLHV